MCSDSLGKSATGAAIPHSLLVVVFNADRDDLLFSEPGLPYVRLSGGGLSDRTREQRRQVSGINASVDGNTYDVRAISWQGAAQMMKASVGVSVSAELWLPADHDPPLSTVCRRARLALSRNSSPGTLTVSCQLSW